MIASEVHTIRFIINHTHITNLVKKAITIMLISAIHLCIFDEHSVRPTLKTISELNLIGYIAKN